MARAAIPRLLDKQIIKVAGESEKGNPVYVVTPLGHTVIKLVKHSLRQFQSGKEAEENLPSSQE